MHRLVPAALILLATGTAHAGVFGGFSADDSRYLRSPDQICTPVVAGARTGAPVCTKADPADVAKAGFRKPQVQAGPRAAFTATARGSDLHLVPAGGGTPIEWQSMDPIIAVNAVYVSQGGKMVAVELRTRLGGHPTEDVVAFTIPDPAAARAAVSAAAKGAPAATRSPAVAKAIDAGNKELKRRHWAKARAAFAGAGDDPEALYGTAVAWIRQKKTADALAVLDQLGASKHPEAPVWRVEARKDKAFSKLLADKRFRHAVGIDPDPSRPLTAYERLVGASGNWEQSGVSCDRPRINLMLKRRPQTFKMLLRSVCHGQRDRASFSGSWQAQGSDRMSLTLPNPGGKDETVACQLAACADGSGEACLTCGAGTDLEMTLELVRR